MIASGAADLELRHWVPSKMPATSHNLVVVFFDRDAEIVTSLNPEDLVGLARLYLRTAWSRG